MGYSIIYIYICLYIYIYIFIMHFDQYFRFRIWFALNFDADWLTS